MGGGGGFGFQMVDFIFKWEGISFDGGWGGGGF